jgi:hypothetical protein
MSAAISSSRTRRFKYGSNAPHDDIPFVRFTPAYCNRIALMLPLPHPNERQGYNAAAL